MSAADGRGATSAGVEGARRQRSGSGPGWGRFFRRLYRLRFVSALLPAAPALLLVAWYSAAAVAEHRRHDDTVGEDRPLTLELFHLHLHDHLARDVRSLARSSAARTGALPALRLSLGADALDALAAGDRPEEGTGAYVNATLRYGGEWFDVKVRYRGEEGWHRSYPQKSWKVRVEGGRGVEGFGTFSLINTPEPLPFDEQMVLDVCRDEGLLTPALFPVRLLFNDAAMGVYYFLGQPDADLIREADRVPGTLYSGDDAPVDEATGVSDLWNAAGYWKTVAEADRQPESPKKMLERLLAVVGRGTQAEFAAFARDHLDVERWATLDAIDVVFGGDRHDFGRNHKLLLDPVTGRFEPIAWDFRDWGHARTLNRVENPLLLRLKELPDYLTRRNRRVWELIHGACRPEEVRGRAERCAADVAADQAADPYWDAYRILPGPRYLTRMVRPMTADRQRVVLEARLAEFERRAAFLTEELALPGIEWTYVVSPSGTGHLVATVDGHVGHRLEEVVPEWGPGCVPAAWSLAADRDLDGRPGGSAGPGAPVLRPDRAARPAADLFPGTRLESRGEPHETRGAVRAVPDPRDYRFVLAAGDCLPAALRIRTTNLVTGEALERRVEAGSKPPAGGPAARGASCRESAAALQPDRRSLHPWCLPEPRPTPVTIGPGTVEIAETREFGPHERVVVMPGTTVEMAPGTSWILRGGLAAIGTAEAPVRFVAGRGRWGGLLLVGPGAAGSVLQHVEVRGGSAPAARLTAPTGMLDVLDTHDVRVAHCRFHADAKVDQVVHAAYVDRLRIDDVEIRNAPDDALDIEFSTATVRRLTVVGARQEGLDVNGGRVALSDSRLLDCRGNALSAGSGARIDVTGTLLAGSRVGLLVKGGAVARLDGVLFYDDGTAAVLRTVDDRASRRTRLLPGEAYRASCPEAIRIEGTRSGPAPVLLHPLPDSALGTLRSDVLGLDDWSTLDRGLAALRRGLP
jgi:hypothetical protein